MGNAEGIISVLIDHAKRVVLCSQTNLVVMYHYQTDAYAKVLFAGKGQSSILTFNMSCAARRRLESRSSIADVKFSYVGHTVLLNSIRKSRVTRDPFYCGNNFFSIYGI